jgi:hypothetical protein
MNSIIIITLILLFALIFISYEYGKYSSDTSLIHGFYEASSDFCKESCIKSFTFYIGNYNNGSYNTYLLMIGNTDDKLLINSPSSMILKRSPLNIFYSDDDCYEYEVFFPDLDTEFIPKNLVLKFYPKSNKIILCGKDNIIYGCLFKNCILTEIDTIKKKVGNVKHATNNDTDDIE